MIDTHCHLEFNQFDGDRDEIIEKSREELKAVIDSAAEAESAKRVMNLHESHPDFIFPCLGYHPNYVLGVSQKNLEKYKQFIRKRKEKLVAIGEVGLDYAHVEDEEKRKETQDRFREFVEFSNEVDLPVVVHSRNAMEDTLGILENKKGKTIIHCFAGNMGQLEEAVSRGYYISYGGLIFRMPNKYKNLVKKTPLEKILLETDAPFLGKEKSSRNEPIFIEEVAERIAEWKNLDFEDVWEQAGENAVEAFSLPINIY